MKKSLALFVAVSMLFALVATGCGSAPDTINDAAFRLSGIDDVSDDNGEQAYLVTAPHTDTYTITSDDTSSIAVYDGGKCLAEGDDIEVELDAGETYTLAVTTEEANADFTVQVEAQNHLVTLPYDIASQTDVSTLSTDAVEGDPLTPASLDYVPREGGTYIYSNNPEQVPNMYVNKAFIKNEGLTGEVYVTFEHANYSGSPFYLGYRLQNDGDTDVYITVENVGYQSTGTWFGQLAWYDFYNTSFALPENYEALGRKFPDYAYQEYTPRVFQPITYRLPAGEYFYVIGGTTEDAYRNINVDDSANEFVNNIRCANGNVKFTVTGGEVTGTMCCYDDPEALGENPESIGYIAAQFAAQYSGIAHHAGVIDNDVVWTFNDETKDGLLPVTYTTRYDENVPTKTTPYKEYNNEDYTYEKVTKWMTHLNPQNNHMAIGTDMVEFIWHDEDGNEVVIDNDHADGAGAPANTANWMIEYMDNFTLVNQGDTDRKVKLSVEDNGSLAMLVRDTQTGEVLKTRFTMGLSTDGPTYTYVVTVPAHSIKQVTFDYLLVACSYGSVTHHATLSNAD